VILRNPSLGIRLRIISDGVRVAQSFADLVEGFDLFLQVLAQ